MQVFKYRNDYFHSAELSDAGVSLRAIILLGRLRIVRVPGTSASSERSSVCERDEDMGGGRRHESVVD